ncbi:MAG: response regulator [Deltaproteobacteria bacterium]|nr:response regulator [Deltaproteobacteria bacterium]
MKKKILIVDDEELVLNSLGLELQGEGYDVTLAANGEEGISFLRSSYFNLLITDLMMEGVNGLEVLKAAKEIDPEIVVVILTGYGEVGSAIESLRLGASDYLLKPCDCSELQLRIAKCLEQQELSKKIKIYEQMLPVCPDCKKVLYVSEKTGGIEEWIALDQYISRKTGLGISHGYCPGCFKEAMQEIAQVKKK